MLRFEAETDAFSKAPKTTESLPQLVSHGDVGIFCVFKKGADFTQLTAKHLRATLQIMKERKRYGQLTFYMESCHSGSMFSTTPTDVKVYAMTSSKPNQLSWADFCPEETNCDTHPEHPQCVLGDCIGLSFGASLLQDAETVTSLERSLLRFFFPYQIGV
ncbi:hypothetical protein AAVH_34021 [Aphelenchoides avenae]|nr:hypothetical protein AAVH_34021 [Aphelenchus avenae]